MMRWLIPMLCAGAMLLRPEVSLQAAADACALFARSVLPGLYPYMILLLVALDRLPAQAPYPLLVALGWGAGSPCGAKICAARQGRMDPRALRRLTVCCGTMSPMFLYGTLGQWLQSPRAGLCILLAVLAGGLTASASLPGGGESRQPSSAFSQAAPISLGAAVEKASITLLTVCGCMVLGNVLSALLPALLPGLPQGARLGIACLAEVTTGSRALALLPLPLELRVALLSGETGFGALAILLQNRALGPRGLMPLWAQLGFQLLHGLLSALVGYGLALLLL
mgnify:FL=1